MLVTGVLVLFVFPTVPVVPVPGPRQVRGVGVLTAGYRNRHLELVRHGKVHWSPDCVDPERQHQGHEGPGRER